MDWILWYLLAGTLLAAGLMLLGGFVEESAHPAAVLALVTAWPLLVLACLGLVLAWALIRWRR